MLQPPEETLRAAETAVRHLIEVCRKDGVLCSQPPKTVAQVNRTSKLLLHAIAALQHELTQQDSTQR